MDSAFGEVFNDLARLAAAAPYLVADREDAVLIIGTKGGVPYTMRDHHIADLQDETACRRLADFWRAAEVDAACALIFTLDPDLADQVAALLFAGQVIPGRPGHWCRVAWVYAGRYWGALSGDAMAWPGGMHPVAPAEPLRYRSFALRLAATMATQHPPIRVQSLPDFRTVPDGTHLAAWEGLPSADWTPEAKPMSVHEARGLARALADSTGPGSLGAAALDCLLAAPTAPWARCHLWRQAEMASTGPERATAASLAALAAWAWSNPDAAQNAVRCALTACPELPFAQDVHAIIGLGVSVDQVIGWARTGEVPGARS
jgi:hypothetical protein